MPEEIFRWVVAIAVILACLSFLIQAGVVLALFRLIKSVQPKVVSLTERAEPIMGTVHRIMEENKPRIAEISTQAAGLTKTVREQVMPRVAEISTEASTMAKSARENVMPRVGEISAEAAVMAKHFRQDLTPKVNEISTDAVAIVKDVRQQVAEIGSVVKDATSRTREKIASIEETVNGTVAGVQQVGDTVRHAVLKPVTEVNAIMAGVRAAVLTYARGQHRASVDHATQDEEMFI